METTLGKNGAYINRIYYCPHHPDLGFKGELKHYKINCSCRKPLIGMIDNAVNDLNIDSKGYNTQITFKNSALYPQY